MYLLILSLFLFFADVSIYSHISQQIIDMIGILACFGVAISCIPILVISVFLTARR